MNHIPKEQWMGCAVATAAMLSGRSYEEVAEHWPELDEVWARSSLRELCAILEAVTDHTWYFEPCWEKPKVFEFSPPQWPVAAWIQNHTTRPDFGQWVVIKGHVIFDPSEQTEYPVADYPQRDWVMTTIIQPVPPKDYARILERRRSQTAVE